MAKSSDDAIRALIRGGVKQADAASIVRSIGPKDVLKGIRATGGAIDGNLLKRVLKISKDPKLAAKIATQNEIVYTKILKNAFKNGKIDDVMVNGKLVKGDFSVDDMVRVSGKSTDDIAKMADDVDVKKAATSRKSDLIKLGISGSMVMGVVFLMLMTGKTNPVEAIAEALKAAAETAADTGGDIFQKLFTGGIGGLFNVSAMFLFCSSVGLVLWLVISVVLKK